jgi:Anp1
MFPTSRVFAGANPLAGYKEFNTGRTYMAKMGDWRQNKDEEVMLDGIGGVNIVVKGDVHRSGMWKSMAG